ncbi:MAG TPA: alpha/beta hydrolase [Candidatus Limnocylindrales bacterium]|nr:alpha/beta hydrolase [Candidatus Limnocylindrales bacterium]
MTQPTASADAEPIRTSIVRANGIAMRLLESGPAEAAQAILFLHGGPGTAERHWAAQLRDFAARGYRCLAPDLRGHGGTGNDRDGLDQALMAEDARALLDVLGVARAHLVGFSVGGVIGLYLALAEPERLASLTTIGSHMTVDEHVLASNRTIDPVTVERDPDRAERLSRLHGVVHGPAHWRRLCVWLMETWARQPDWSDADLARVRVPALIGRGELDDRVTQAQVDRMVAAIPGARGFVVPGAGHYFHTTSPGREALDAILRGFLPPA